MPLLVLNPGQLVLQGGVLGLQDVQLSVEALRGSHLLHQALQFTIFIFSCVLQVADDSCSVIQVPLQPGREGEREGGREGGRESAMRLTLAQAKLFMTYMYM